MSEATVGTKVVIRDIRRGSKEQGRDKFTYAKLYGYDDGSLIIGATLDYIQKAIKDRGYIRVTEDGIEYRRD